MKDFIFKNSFLLMFSTGFQFLVAFIVWVVATRSVSSDMLGYSSTIMSTAAFLSILSSFGLDNALLKYANSLDKSKLYSSCLLVSVLFALGLGILFELLPSSIFPILNTIRSDLFLTITFPIYVAILAASTIYVAIALSMNKSIIVLLNGVVFSIGRLILIFFASYLGKYSFFNIMVLASILPILLLVIFIKLDGFRISYDILLKVVKFAGTDFVITLVDFLPTIVIPNIIMLSGLVISNNTYFYVCWMIVAAVNAVLSCLPRIALSRGNNIADYKKILVITIPICVMATLVIFIFSGYILSVFGIEYSAAGSGLLKVLSLSILPYNIMKLYSVLARSKGLLVSFLREYIIYNVLIFVATYFIGNRDIYYYGLPYSLLTISYMLYILFKLFGLGKWRYFFGEA